MNKIILALNLLIFLLAGCNPIAPSMQASKVDETHNPGEEVKSLSFQVQPSLTGTTDNDLLIQPVIVVKNSSNQIISFFKDAITLKAYSDANCEIEVVSGMTVDTNPVTAESGLARFSGLRVVDPEVKRIGAHFGDIKTCSKAISIIPGNAVAIEFEVFPSSTSNTDSDLAQQPRVVFKNSINSTATNVTSPVTLTAYSDASCTTPVASGISFDANPVNAVSGKATFSGLRILKTNVIRIGASAGPYSVCSQPLTVAPGALSSMAFTVAPSSVANTDTDLASQPEITLYDANGNILKSNSTSTVTISAHSDTTCTSPVASGLSATANPVTVTQGVAVFTNLRILKTQIVRIKAAVGVNSICSQPLAVSPGALSSLAFTVAPSSVANTDTDLAAQPVVTLYDASGNILTSNSTSTVTLSAHSDTTCTSPVASGLSATTNPVTVTQGVAAFTNLKILKTQIVRIKAAVGSTSICSPAIAVSPGALSSLAYTVAPSSVANTDIDLAAQPEITLYDNNGNILTSNSTSTVTLSAHSDTTCTSPVASALSATANPVTVTQGVAAFKNLRILKTQIVRIKAVVGSTSICSSAIAVSPGALSSLAFTVAPSSVANTDTDLSAQPVVTLYDANGNILTSNSILTVSLTAHSDATCTSPVASALTATSNPLTVSQGVATFTNLRILKTQIVRIKAVVGSTSICSSAIAVSPGILSLASSSFSLYPRSLKADNVASSSLTVTLKDTNNNPLVGAAVTVSSSRGDSITNSPASTNSNGVATLSIKSAVTGESTLTVNAGATVITNSLKLLFLSDTPTLDFQARLADEGQRPGSNATTTSYWKNLSQFGLTNDAALNGFASTMSSWGINRLNFNGTSDALDLGNSQNAQTSFAVEAWVRPENVMAKGKVLVSNGETTSAGTISETNAGITIKQSKTEAGKIEIHLGEKSYADEVLSDDPVAYWRLGEVTGIANDSKSNFHGSYKGPITAGEDPRIADSNKASLFNGTTSSVALPAINLTATDKVTVELWYKPAVALPAGPKILYEFGADFNNVATAFVIAHETDGKIWARLKGNSGYNDWRSTTLMTVGTWYHIVATFDKSLASEEAKLYINGSLDGATTLTANNTGNFGTFVSFIASRNNANLFVNGRLDDVSLYAKVLTSNQIKAHYYAGIKRLSCTSSSTLVDSSWNHLVGQYDQASSTLKLFMNGIEHCSSTLSGSSLGVSANNLNFAQDITASNFWSGALSDLRTYGTALGVPQIQANIAATSPRFDTKDILPITTNLQVWLKADEIKGLVDEDKVTAWNDASGNNNHAYQLTLTKQPKYKTGTTGINGRPVVYFSGAQILNIDAVSLSSQTIFVVSKVTGNGLLFEHGINVNSIQGSYLHTTLAASSSVRRGSINSTYNYISNWGSTGASALAVQTFAGTHASHTLHINSALKSMTTLTNANPGTATINADFYIGGRSQATYYITGGIAEILVYNSALSDSERAKVEAYLNAKYNLWN